MPSQSAGRTRTHKAPLYRAPRGTSDVLPAEQPYWRLVRETAERVCRAFGYQRIDTPTFEDARLFLRGVGEGTDIVEKEMYLFEDRGGERMALRPEGTANTCRAYLQHGMHVLPQPVRLYYISPIFRYDRPQAGRYREHTQLGAEAIGDGDPLVDAEIIDLLSTFYSALGLRGLTLHLNSSGDQRCRPGYLRTLRDYYADKLDRVCSDCRLRYEKNPLRLLDCKQRQCQPVIAGAPPITESLCDDCAAHFQALRGYLRGLGIAHKLNPRLVRGMDYYTRTVFEFQPVHGGAQSTVGGGGRYDGLIELLGGPPTPGIGFGTGFERIILNLKRQGVEPPGDSRPLVYVAHQSEGARQEALRLASLLRRQHIPTIVAVGERSLKSQMRQADGLGVAYTVILGERETAAGTVLLKSMADGSQRELPHQEALDFLAREIGEGAT
jgi:histidyl-tRNA synthetase